MSNRHSATRTARTRDRAARRETLLVLLGRLDRLSPTEAALLLEYAHAELAASDALRSTLVGLERTLQVSQDRTRAAEVAIVEAEQDRDHANARAESLFGDVERLGGYLVGAKRAAGAPSYADVPEAVRALAASAAQCFEMAHEKRLDRAQQDEAAVRRVRVLATRARDTWTDIHPADVLTALDHPEET
ncbi:hypothetical protein [Streptomyces gardneri]|uniref:hypothetical protein n=1 Tax=Streptomyces gardneri TaxID=66892 RepID=UPI0035D7B5D0